MCTAAATVAKGVARTRIGVSAERARSSLVMRRSIVALLSGSLAALLAGCCGAGPAHVTEGSSSNGAHVALAPRMDLHCTPQSADDEAKCHAQGDDRTYGPPLVCRGTPPPPEEEKAEREAWEKGTSPCTCYGRADIERCSQVP